MKSYAGECPMRKRPRFSPALFLFVLMGVSSMACSLTTEAPTANDGESSACEPLSVAVCPYSGPPSTAGVGVCRVAFKSCNVDGKGWGACQGEILPSTENCSTLADEDCDGQVNQPEAGCACIPGTAAICYSGALEQVGVGICTAGLKECAADGKAFGPCIGEHLSGDDEDCATPFDDDCDGETNEDCSCSPGTVVPCYEGPTGTLDVGECKAGVQFCDAATLQLGPCVGGSVPTAEVCTNSTDEDCDGIACSYPLWARSFGSTGKDLGNHVAVDPLDNLILVGQFEGTVDFGTGPLVSKGGSDIFVAKFDEFGNCLWSYGYGSTADDSATYVAADGTGNVAVTGWISGTASFGGGLLAFGGVNDPFIATFDSAGQHIWSTSFRDAGDGVGASIAFTTSGDVLMTARLQGATTYDGGSLVTLGGDVLVTKYDAVGNHLWTKIMGDGSLQEGFGVASDGSNNVLVTGVFGGSIDFGGGPLTAVGTRDIFVAKLDATGNHLWSRRFGGPLGDITNARITVDLQQDVILAGGVVGPVDFGGGPLSSAGADDIFVAKLDQATGAHIWSHRFGDGYSQSASAVATDNAGNVLVAGQNAGAVDFGGGPFQSEAADLFVVKFGPSGNHIWSKGLGDAGADGARSVRANSSGGVVLAGIFQLNPDFGLGPLVSPGGPYDIFLASFAP